MIIESKVDPEKATHAYMALLDALEPFTPAETMAATMVYIGIQWDRSLIGNDEKMRRYIKDASAWLSAYFAEGTEQ